MKKNCENCKYIKLPRKCLDTCWELRMCSKNNLFINYPDMHYCDMYEEVKSRSSEEISSLMDMLEIMLNR